jgi:hypothetical protein
MDNCIIIFVIILTQFLQSLSNSLVNNLLGQKWVLSTHEQSQNSEWILSKKVKFYSV